LFISSRVCGDCGGVHSVASALAMEMAFGIGVPPMGIALRNIQLSLDFQIDNPVHLYLLAGPDFSQVVIERTNPSLWERAKKTETRHGNVHGFKTMAEMFTAFNPLTGKLYLEGLHMTRPPKEAYAILYGKYPHPQTVVPGGLSTTVSLQVLNETQLRILRTLDYAKRGVSIPGTRRPSPGRTSGRWKDRYTWSTAPRWNRQVVEAGAYARLWTTAAAGKMPHNRFIESTGTSVKIDTPQTAALPAIEFEWKIPEIWNAFERNHADPRGVRLRRDLHRNRHLPRPPLVRPLHALHRARRQRGAHDHPGRNDLRVRGRLSVAARVLIGGVGYRWCGDASFGLVATDELAPMPWRDGVRVEDLGYGALHAAMDLADADPPYERVILIGATERCRQPGRLYRFPLRRTRS
jgi:hypothetical protein